MTKNPAVPAEGAVPRATWVPPGHFYSPIPDPAEIERRSDQIFHRLGTEIKGVDLDHQGQMDLLSAMLPTYRDDLFEPNPTNQRRYGWQNDYFPYGDAFFLTHYIQRNQPQRIIEVGSGWSSASMLDLCDDLRVAGRRVPNLTFIEPYPERLRSLLHSNDSAFCTILEQQVQDVPLATFQALGAGDLLFIDSSHVIKTGSDLAYLFFDVFPILAKGVWLFIHDIPWPFEYPRVWVDEGRAWNEVYLLRAFLQYNETFKIRFLPGYALGMTLERATREAPMLVKNVGTGIWIQKVK
jgi:Methyltransferase domain